MVELKPRSTSWNSLWSIIYCAIVLCLQGYISYRAISTFQDSLMDKWKDNFPSALSARLALTILSLILTPIFIITCLFKVGNYANDGYKLGRDHALCQIEGNFVDKFTSESWRKLWQNFVPFSQTLHVIIAFFLLLPETLVESAEIYYGHKPSSYIWDSNIDFLFSTQRLGLSDIMMTLNQSMRSNMTSLTIVQYESSLVSVEFVFYVMALVCYTVRYSSVFWYTNKALSLTFAFQLLFMCFESIFSFTGFSLLYKISDNAKAYNNAFQLILGRSGGVILYLLSGFIILSSTMAVFYYGSQHFHEKFRIVDRKHHPQKYLRHKRTNRGICSGYVSHTCAVGTWMLLALFKGPILYDLITVFRRSNDSLVLACILIEVMYMIFWIGLWTLLTIKQKWLFRILDYANVGEPIFVIKSDSLLRTPSISIGSIELNDIHMAREHRPSSIPSVDITPSESGFDELEMPPSAEDERFEMSLTPVRENPGDNDTNSVTMRRSRNRRSGARSVTFHDTVRRNSGMTDSNLSVNRCVTPSDTSERVNVTADVHLLTVGSRRSYTSPHRRSASDIERLISQNSRRGTPIPNDLQAASSKPANVRNIHSQSTNNLLSSSCSRDNASSPSDSLKGNQPHGKPRVQSLYIEQTRQPDRKVTKPSNIEAAEERDKHRHKQSKYTSQDKVHPKNELIKGVKSSEDDEQRVKLLNDKDHSDDEHRVKLLNDKDYSDINESKQPDIVPKQNLGLLYPRPLHLLGKKTDKIRRDSANYSLASSQDTSSNDSDHAQQLPLCSQV